MDIPAPTGTPVYSIATQGVKPLVSWFEPQKLSSCLFGNYAIKEHTQAAIQTTLETSVSSGIESYEKNLQQRPTKTIYPNTVIRAAR